MGAPASAYIAHIHPDDFLAFTAAMQAAFAKEGALSHEFRLTFPDGTERWLSDAHGNPVPLAERPWGSAAAVDGRGVTPAVAARRGRHAAR